MIGVTNVEKLQESRQSTPTRVRPVVWSYLFSVQFVDIFYFINV